MTTYDKLKVTLSSKDEAEDFIALWDSVFEETFGFEYFEVNGVFTISVEAAPLFSTFENGSRIDRVVLDCLKKHPSSTFELEYTNGIGIAFKYTFKDGILIRKMICDSDGFERDGMDYCEECDSEFDPAVFTLLSFDPEKEYLCPSCGTDLLEQFRPTVETFEIKLVSNEWVYPEGFTPPKAGKEICPICGEELDPELPVVLNKNGDRCHIWCVEE